MHSHLVRLSGMAGDVLGNGEAMARPQQLHTLTLTQKLEVVVNNEYLAKRADHAEIAASTLAIFFDVLLANKHPQESWVNLEDRGIRLFKRGFEFIKRNCEERRPGA